MLPSVDDGLLPLVGDWNALPDEPTAAAIVGPVLDWAKSQLDVQSSMREAYRLDENAETGPAWASVLRLVRAWLDGKRYQEMAQEAELPVDDLLGVHSRLVGHVLQTTVEQGVALLSKLLEERGASLPRAVTEFPECLRFGVPSRSALALASLGLRHRTAAVELGSDEGVVAGATSNRDIRSAALDALQGNPNAWRGRLGELVFQNTVSDLESMLG